jgi:hypothetical protein
MLAELMLAAAMFAPQAPQGVVINELSYDDTGSDNLEFVELYNGGATNVDISGWTLTEEDGSSASGNVHTIAGTILAPGEFWVIGDTAVPNIDETLSYSLENGPDAVFLSDSLGVYQDSVAWEVQNWSNPIPVWLEGDGLAGDIQLHEHGGMFQNSISRGIDGFDTDDNGCDFRPAPWTPGTLNILGMTTTLPYSNDFDGPVGTDVTNDFTFSFVSGNVVDPLALTSPVPPSPQGGNCAAWYDPTGGGNANWLNNFTQSDYMMESYVYVTGPNGLFDGDDGENWTMGVRGHSDSFGEYQNVGGFHGVVSCTTTQSGHTGIAWVCNRTQLTAELYLVDFNNGAGDLAGGEFTVLGGPISIQAGVNDGWQRVRLCVQGSSVVGNFGGNYGCDDGQRFTASTNTVCANGVYLTYRECVTNNLNLQPLMTDGLFIGDCTAATSTLAGTGSPSSIGTPTISAPAPIIGDSAFAITVSGLIPGGAPFAGIVLDTGTSLPGIPIPGAPPSALLYVSPTIVTIGFADASGNASFGIPLPCNQALMGKSLLAQGFDWDATLGFSLPVAMSPALILTLGY